MDAVGLNWERLLENRTVRAEEFGELNRIAETISVHLSPIVEGRVARIRAREAEQRLSDVTRRVEGAGTSRLGSRLVAALRGQKVGAYEEAHRELTSAHALRATWVRRKALLEKLRAAAPAWATSLERRLAPHDQHQPPQQASRAWLVRQLQEELTRRAALDSGLLQKEGPCGRTRTTTTFASDTTSLRVEPETSSGSCTPSRPELTCRLATCDGVSSSMPSIPPPLPDRRLRLGGEQSPSLSVASRGPSVGPGIALSRSGAWVPFGSTWW